MAHALLSRLTSAIPVGGLVLALAVVARAAPDATRDEGDDQYRFLVGLIDKGMYERAIGEAQIFLDEYPDHDKAPLARYRLATALFELDRWEEATPYFDALARQPRFEYRAESAFRLGQCQLSRERLAEAEAAFETVLRLDQDYLHGPATFFLGETALRAKRVDEAEERYHEILRDHPDSEYLASTRRGLSWCSWERGEVEQTVRRTQTYLQHHGGEQGADEVRALLGDALLEAGLPRDSLAAFNGIRSTAFGDARRRGAGFAHAALGDPSRAAREFAALLEEVPESRFADEARLQLGIQTLRAGDAKAAVRALRTAAKGNDPETAYWLSQAQTAAGNDEAALRTLDRALEAGPGPELTARIQVARGDLLNRLGRADAALVAYESGGSDYALYAAAVAGLNRGDADNAIRLVGKLFDTHPETSYRIEASLVLGEAYFARENLARAEETFLMVLAADPTPRHAAQALNRVGWCRYLAGDLEGAAARFEELARGGGDTDEAEEGLYMLGRVRLEAGDADGAREANGQYLRRHPRGRWHDEVLFACARVSTDEEAERGIETLLAQHPESPLIPRALLELGDRLSEAGRYDEAEPRYAAILERHGRSDVAPEAAYGLAWCRYQQGDYAASAALLERVGADRSTGDELRSASFELCVWAHCKNGDPQAATVAWRALARVCDDDARLFEAARSVVAGWRDAGRPRQGQAVLDELLPQLDDPDVTVSILLEGAYLALEQGDVDHADAQVQVARRRAEGTAKVAEASFFVGEARFANGDDERAIALYRAAATEASPVRADALYKLGFALLRTEDLAGAEGAFLTLVDQHRGSALWGESLFLLGETRFRRERYAASVEALERLRSEAPDHEVLPKALFRMGIVLGRLERWEGCEAALAQLARADPEFPNLAEAELWRGRALAAQRKVRAARQAYKRVAALDRGQLAAQAGIGLGRLLEGEGRIDEALSQYLKVAVLFGHDEEVAEALYRAGSCLEQLGDTDKAVEQYREIVAEHPSSGFAVPARERLQTVGTQ